MTKIKKLKRYKYLKMEISSHKGICHGRWCIDGTRVAACVLIETLDAGYNKRDILQMYPSLKGKI